MRRLKFSILYVIIFSLTGCFERDDFVGVSFDTTPQELKAKGYTCFKDGKSLRCQSPVSNVVFGYKAAGVKVIFHDGDESACCISVDLRMSKDVFSDVKPLVAELDKKYQVIREETADNSLYKNKQWRRDDGSKLNIFYYNGLGEGIGGGNLTAYRPGLKTRGDASVRK